MLLKTKRKGIHGIHVHNEKYVKKNLNKHTKNSQESHELKGTKGRNTNQER